ncbi:MAG: DMT family transporter [Planctomycetes bacterium]|nr:DMT family transporter [Planctomycetota bacterium]
MKHGKSTGLLFATFSGLLFGTASILIRFAGSLDSFLISALRLTIGACVVLLFILVKSLIQEKRLGFPKMLHLKSVVFLSIISGVHFLSFVIAMKTGVILRALIIVNSAPVLVLVIKTFLMRKIPSRIEIVAIMLAFTGIAILVTKGKFNTVFLGENLLMTDFWAFICAISYAAYIIWASESRKTRASSDIMFVFFLSGALLLWIVFAAKQSFFGYAESSINTWSTLNFNENLIYVLLLGVIPTGIGHFMFNFSFRFMPVLTTATITVLEPVTGGIYAAILFPNQTLEPIQYCGIALSLAGLIIISLVPAKKPD